MKAGLDFFAGVCHFRMGKCFRYSHHFICLQTV